MSNISEAKKLIQQAFALLDEKEINSKDLREIQSKRLYDLGFGKTLGFDSFDSYLASIPEIPDFPQEQKDYFGADNIFLIDGRVAEKVGVKEYCKLIGLNYFYDEDIFQPHDKTKSKAGVRWMIGQAGHKNRNISAKECRKDFKSFEVGMDWVEGAGVYALDPKVIVEHYLDLPGSVPREGRKGVAYVGLIVGNPGLSWSWVDDVCSSFGSASRGE